MVVASPAKLLYAERMSMSLAPGSDRIELVETFVRIVETGSLSAAANRLGTSQPTVSRRLQILEKWLGLKLLQRSTHAMSLTKDGERFFARAQELLENWTAMEEDLRGATTDPFGLLRVVVPHAFGQKQMIGPLLEFLKRYPKVSIEWLLHQHHPDFIANGVDCEIRLGIVEDPGLVALHLAEVPRIVVAAPSLCGKDPSKISLDRLQSMPWIAISIFYKDEVVLTRDGEADAHRFPIKPRLCTDSVYATRQAALAGFGATLISAWIVADDIEKGRLIQLVPQWQGISLPVYLVYPYARFYPAKLRRFIELMRKAMPTLVGVRPLSKRTTEATIADG
jgi:DNA-binding transcriptional LysR family regulator